MSNTENVIGKRIKATVVIIAIFASIVLVIGFVSNNPATKYLKYDWGTHIDEVRKNEYVYEEHVPSEEMWQFSDYQYYLLVCEDPKHTVDPLKEFDIEGDRKGTWDVLISDKVTYEFSSRDKSLFHIYYEYDSMSFAERMEIATEYYGKDYYVYGDEIDDYESAVWKLGNTVVFIDYYGVDYYDADYYIPQLEKSRDKLSDRMEGILNFLKK